MLDLTVADHVGADHNTDFGRAGGAGGHGRHCRHTAGLGHWWVQAHHDRRGWGAAQAERYELDELRCFPAAVMETILNITC